MHRADIAYLEDMLKNQEKWRKKLRTKETDLEYSVKEDIAKSDLNRIGQDPRTISGNLNSSVVENLAIKRADDVEYMILKSIVNKTRNFVDGLDDYERIIYDYRYREKDLSIYEWEDIAMKLTQECAGKNRAFSKSTTLRLRERMLLRFANYVGIVLIEDF